MYLYKKCSILIYCLINVSKGFGRTFHDRYVINNTCTLFQVTLEDVMQTMSETYGLGTASRWWTTMQSVLLSYMLHFENEAYRISYGKTYVTHRNPSPKTSYMPQKIMVSASLSVKTLLQLVIVYVFIHTCKNSSKLTLGRHLRHTNTNQIKNTQYGINRTVKTNKC